MHELAAILMTSAPGWIEHQSADAALVFQSVALRDPARLRPQTKRGASMGIFPSSRSKLMKGIRACYSCYSF